MTRRVLSMRPENRADSLFLPVGTVEELRQVAVNDVADKIMCLVEDTGLYRYDYHSTANEDLQDFTVVTPQVGVGRWIKFQDASTTRRADLKEIGSIGSGTNHVKIINALMTGEVPEGNEDSPGILTQEPTNWVWVRMVATGLSHMAGEYVVYGRTTFESAVLTGSLTFNNGNAVVVGSNTLFSSEIAAGQFIKLAVSGDGSWAQVDHVVNNTHLVLADPLAGTSGSGPSRKGDWLLSFYKRVNNADVDYAFPSNLDISIRVLKSFRASDLPFVSYLYEPWTGGSSAGGGGGGGGWDALERFEMDGSTDTVALLHSDMDLADTGHMVVKNGMVMDLGEDYTTATGLLEEKQIVFLDVPSALDKVVVRYMRISL